MYAVDCQRRDRAEKFGEVGGVGGGGIRGENMTCATLYWLLALALMV